MLIKKLINEIDIDVEGQPHRSHKGNMLTISPVRQYQKFKYENLPGTLTDTEFYKLVSGKDLRIPDFRNSRKFYDYFKNKKQDTPKILSDYYSYERSKLLYEYLATIETSFRNIFLETYGKEEYKPRAYRSKDPDHPIAQFSTYEFIVDKLLALSSTKYFLKNINRANDNKKAEIRYSTKLDELGFGISSDELIDFNKIRNAVMHFRVVTTENTEFVLKLAAKIEQLNFKRIVGKIAKTKPNQN